MQKLSVLSTHKYGRQRKITVLQIMQRSTLSPLIPLRLYTLPYWSNPPFLIFDIRALWRSGLSVRVPECQKLKMVGQTSMALNPSNSSNLEQLALKGLNWLCIQRLFSAIITDFIVCIGDVDIRTACYRCSNGFFCNPYVYNFSTKQMIIVITSTFVKRKINVFRYAVVHFVEQMSFITFQ